MGLIISWLTLAGALWVAERLLVDFELRGGFGSYMLIAAVFGVINFCVGWLLFVVIGVASLGLGFIFAFVTRLIVTAIVLKVVDALSTRLTIRGFSTALIAAVIMAVVGSAADWVSRTVF